MKAGLITQSCIALGKVNDANELKSIAQTCKAIPSTLTQPHTVDLTRRAASPFMKVA